MALYLDGLACLGKTTTLKRLSEKYQVAFCDFSELAARYPLLRNKHEDSSVQCLYTNIFFNTAFGADLVDRSPIADVVYNFIRNNPTRNADAIFPLLEEEAFKEALSQINTILLVPHNTEVLTKILDEMKFRKNNIDILTPHYMQQQFVAFQRIAKIVASHPSRFSSVCVVPIYEACTYNIDGKTGHYRLFQKSYFDFLENLVDIIYQKKATSHESVKMVFCEVKYDLPTPPELEEEFKADALVTKMQPKKYVTDAGIDLQVDGNYVLEPGVSINITMQQSISIKPGYVGLLTPRSSTSKWGLANVGIIDSGYTGKLQIMFTPNTNAAGVVLEHGLRYFQIVVVPCSLNPLAVDKLEDIPGQRGHRGFGSTGN